jgi:hypothetical protein
MYYVIYTGKNYEVWSSKIPPQVTKEEVEVECTSRRKKYTAKLCKIHVKGGRFLLKTSFYWRFGEDYRKVGDLKPGDAPLKITNKSYKYLRTLC